MLRHPSPYNKNNPFYTSVIDRYNLCHPDSEKNTQHLVLDLKNSEITYEVGDSIAIFPKNDPILVEKTLHAMGCTGNEVILEKQTKEPIILRQFLEVKANVTDVSRKFLSEIGIRQADPEKKAFIESLFSEESHEHLKTYLAHHELWDTLEENKDAVFTPQEICDLLMPQLPRFYSISSSNKVVGNEVHLTVGLLKYHTNGHQRLGVCTHYLCNLVPLNEPTVGIYLHPHKGFTVPENPETPIIMIGPGTGIAPFRAFMQERMAQNAQGKNWLFFGERRQAYDFLYEDYWKQLTTAEKLRLDVAFSRDQDYKIYVQHRMEEHGEELYQWINQGAYIYVCGDIHHMAKDVEKTLQNIIQKYGSFDELESKNYLKKLRLEKRYLRDVY